MPIIACTYCGNQTFIDEERMDSSILKSSAMEKMVCRRCKESMANMPVLSWLHGLKNSDPYRWERVVEFNHGKRGDVAKMIQEIGEE